MPSRSRKAQKRIHGVGGEALDAFGKSGRIPHLREFPQIIIAIKTRNLEFDTTKLHANRWDNISQCSKQQMRCHWVAHVYNAFLLWEMMWKVENLSMNVVHDIAVVLLKVFAVDNHILENCKGIQSNDKMSRKMKMCWMSWDSQKHLIHHWALTRW